MQFNTETHHRRSIRLPEYDYCQAGSYFVTICTRNRDCLLGESIDGSMQLNPFGQIVQACWEDLPRHYPYVELDVFVAMPNHIHGILSLPGPVGAQFIAPNPTPGVMNHAPTLGQIIRAFKATSTRLMRKRGFAQFGWQHNYYEHIIRDEKSLGAIREYIVWNPTRWTDDAENPINLVKESA